MQGEPMPYKNKQDRNRNARELHATGRYYKVKRDGQLKRLYGITLEKYKEMFQEQNGCCKICKTHQDELAHTLCVDHNHITSIVRGLLCKSCNLTLGRIENNINDYADYIREYNQ